MTYRRDPETTEDHLAYIYELLRRLRFHDHPLQPFEHTHPSNCPCPVNVRHCTISSPYDEYSGTFTEGDWEVRYQFADFADYDQWILGNDPVVYYRLDETSGTAINDASPNNNDGVTSGGPTLNLTGPLSGMKAVSFDGVDDKIHSFSNIEVAVTRWMYVFWIKTTSAGGTGGAICHTADSTLDSSAALGAFLGYHGSFGSATPGAVAFADNSHNLAGGRHTGASRVDDGNWHIVHCIWVGGDVGGADPSDYAHYKIYIDGVKSDVGNINEGVNTSCHGTPKTGTALNIAFNPLSNVFEQFTLAGFAAFDQETVAEEASECQLYCADDVLIVDGTGGTLPIPAAADCPTKHQWVKNISTGDIILDPAGNDVIEEALTFTLMPLDSAHLFSDGVEWFIL